MSYDVKTIPFMYDLLNFNALHFFLKHISQIIRIISKDIKALYNAQLTLRCSQSLYLCETMNDKEEKLVSNDKSVRLSLVTTIHPLRDMKG